MADRKKVSTPVFRGSFVNLFEPRAFKNSKPKYGVTMVFDVKKFTERDKKLWKEMKAILDEACMKTFGKNYEACCKNRQFKAAIRDCSEKESLDGFAIEGGKFAAASSLQRPGVVDRNKQTIVDAEEAYSGAYYRATVTAYAFNNEGQGVAFGLHNIQKLGDGESLTGRVPAEDDFGDDADEAFPSDVGAGEDDDV